jgi:hypothetical protein
VKENQIKEESKGTKLLGSSLLSKEGIAAWGVETEAVFVAVKLDSSNTTCLKI